MRGFAKIICLGFVLAACGGSSDAPPRPLDKHFNDMYIARIPLEQKQSVVTTNNDYSVAKMEEATAQAQYEETDAQLHQARNDAKAAKLQVDSAVSAKKMADTSADQNRVNQAVKDLHTAEDLDKAAQARVKYLEDYRNYMKVYWRYTQENTYWREAQFEQAKAKLAKSNNIAPKGVNYDTFPKQLDERQKRTQSAKERAEGDKQKVVSARDNWLKIQDQADKENGRASVFWDPMAPKTATPPPVNANPTPTSPPPTAPTPSGGAAPVAGGGSAAAPAN